jgi:hypothetical protein
VNDLHTSKYTVEMASDGIMYIPSFMTFGFGIRLILRASVNNLRGCNVGFTDRWD